MSRLDIHLDSVRSVAQELERTSQRLSQTMQQLSTIRSRIDNSIQSRRDIGHRLQRAYSQLLDAERRLRQLTSFLQQAADRYGHMEDGLARQAVEGSRSGVSPTESSIDWIDWSKVPANLVDSLQASIEASANQQASASAPAQPPIPIRADSLEDVWHVGGYTLEGPERTRYYKDRHGNLLPVDSERMLALIESYNRTYNKNLHTPDVAIFMNVDVTEFLRYTMEQGIDPRTFQPVNPDDAREIEGYVAARQQHGEEKQGKTRAWQSEMLEWIPGVAAVKEIADVIGGKDSITGEPLTKLDYAIAALSAFGPIGKAGKKGIKFAADKGVGNAAAKLTPGNIPNMSKKEILDNLPDGWNYTDNNGFVHVRDANGTIRMRIDPPDKVTKYDHVHLFDENKNSIDVTGNIVNPKSPDAHIPYKK